MTAIKTTLFPTIGVFPRINLRITSHGARKNDPVLSNDTLFLYSSGRSALYAAARATGFAPGSRFLMPAFHCGVEVEAVRLAGYGIDFYNIGPELRIDFPDLHRRVKTRTKAMVIIHYFGRVQDMDYTLDFCRTHDLVLIEDCAHALYSSFCGIMAGQFGTFAAYSLRKSIGLPDGGALLRNSSKFRDPQKGIVSSGTFRIRSAARSILEYEAGAPGTVGGKIARYILSLRKPHPSGPKDLTSWDSLNSDISWKLSGDLGEYMGRMSPFSRVLLGTEDYQSILAKRRKNYGLIDDAIPALLGMTQRAQPLTEGTCPLCYVLETRNRDNLVREMRRHGVDPYIFGASSHPLLPKDEFPHIADLRNRLFGLPVHQHLSEEDIAKVLLGLRDAGRTIGSL